MWRSWSPVRARTLRKEAPSLNKSRALSRRAIPWGSNLVRKSSSICFLCLAVIDTAQVDFIP
jgi:hypothetical protein